MSDDGRWDGPLGEFDAGAEGEGMEAYRVGDPSDPGGREFGGVFRPFANGQQSQHRFSQVNKQNAWSNGDWTIYLSPSRPFPLLPDVNSITYTVRALIGAGTGGSLIVNSFGQFMSQVGSAWHVTAQSITLDAFITAVQGQPGNPNPPRGSIVGYVTPGRPFTQCITRAFQPPLAITGIQPVPSFACRWGLRVRTNVGAAVVTFLDALGNVLDTFNIGGAQSLNLPLSSLHPDAVYYNLTGDFSAGVFTFEVVR